MKVLASHKKAFFDYQVLEKFEAGLVLIGQEVKSIKKGQISLKGAYVVPKESELFLIGAHVPAYQPKNITDYNPERTRKILLKKKDLNYLIGRSKEKGLTLIPLQVYTRNGLIKVEVGVGKGRKSFDKRDLIKKRDVDKRIRQSLRG